MHFKPGTSPIRILYGHFGPVYLLQVSKNDGEEHLALVPEIIESTVLRLKIVVSKL